MVNQTGIAITIKAFLPTGKTLDEQFAALSIVKAAHESGDYTALLKAAGVDEVKTEQKTRRVEEPTAVRLTDEIARHLEVIDDETGEVIQQSIASQEDDSGLKAEFDKVEPAGEIDPVENPDVEVPEFIKKGRSKAA
ncbi:hypothetical protein AX761_22730 [Rhizobium sp. 58]|nr:hypothetical protein AX761_22730 [Rhizobium sp. 58]